MFMCTAINHINLSCRLSRLLYKYSGENVRVGDTEHLPNYTKQDTTHLCVSLSQLIIKYSSEADRDPRPETRDPPFKAVWVRLFVHCTCFGKIFTCFFSNQ